MANTLKIIKDSDRVFWHIPNGIDTNKFAISDFEISLDGNIFKIVEIEGDITEGHTQATVDKRTITSKKQFNLLEYLTLADKKV